MIPKKNIKLKKIYCYLILLFAITITSCKKNQHQNVIDASEYYSSTKPCTRWWWFATEIKKPDIKHQLDWAKDNNFGGVEIAWVYPLYRYQKMYARSYGRHYPKDSSAQEWLVFILTPSITNNIRFVANPRIIGLPPPC